MITINTVNKALATKGLKLIRWNGYFTLEIIDIDILPLPDYVKEASHLINGDQLGEMITICKLNQTDLEGWVSEADIMLEEVTEQYDHLKEGEGTTSTIIRLAPRRTVY